jgi:hypothetical protein
MPFLSVTTGQITRPISNGKYAYFFPTLKKEFSIELKFLDIKTKKIASSFQYGIKLTFPHIRLSNLNVSCMLLMILALVGINHCAQFKIHVLCQRSTKELTKGISYFPQSNLKTQNFPNWARYFFPKIARKGLL